MKKRTWLWNHLFSICFWLTDILFKSVNNLDSQLWPKNLQKSGHSQALPKTTPTYLVPPSSISSKIVGTVCSKKTTNFSMIISTTHNRIVNVWFTASHQTHTFKKKNSRAATIVVGLALVIFNCHRFLDCVFHFVKGIPKRGLV